MRHNTSVTTMAAALALALALLVGVLLPSDSPVYAEPPEFDTDTNVRSVDENTPAGVNIGAPISATDPDETGSASVDAMEFGNTLTYSIDAASAAVFDIDSSTGQLITKAPLDADSTDSYSVTVTVDDGETRDSPITQVVKITVTGVTETPLAPLPPTVVSGVDQDDGDPDESTNSLKVVWHPPENMGRPDISSYAVEFKKSTETTFGDTGVKVASFPATTATITGLEADTSYDVRVQATNSDGPGLWSLVGTGSTNKEGNSAPSFGDKDSLVNRDVDENTPAEENVDGPVTATDADTTTLTYGIEGPHAGMFSFDNRSGQIRTKAPLNHEDARCGYDDTAGTTECIYRVTVTVVDTAGGSDATRVHIEIDDRDEPPSAPTRPTVRATENSSTSLDVSWSAPDNMGPPITGYTVEYRKGSEAFSADGVSVTGTTATISGVDTTNDDTPWLSPYTSYEVRVRAINAERSTGGPWSATGTGRTNRANHQPIFDERPHTGTGSERGSKFTVSRRVDENTGPGQSVGRVFADDTDNDRLTYALSGDDAGLFDIDPSTGQIRTKAGVTYNYEAITATDTCFPLTDTARIGSDRCHTVMVEVRDGLNDDRVEEEETDPDDSITVKIGVRDRDEPPATPTVTVTSPSGNTTLEVFWDARNTGPVITHYDLQYRKGGGTFSDDNCEVTGDNNCTRLDDDTTVDNATKITTTTIVDLEEDTSYSVQVRATNAEGTSAWSPVVTVKTNKDREIQGQPDQSNTPPVITPPTLTVDENTPSGRDVGTASYATDDATNSPTYSLGGRDATLFTIVSTTGQIRTRSALNHEDPACGYDSTQATTSCTYTVRVKVDDRAGGSASVPLTITVNDVDEPPSAPSALRVTATKDTGWSLDVTWNEPRDTGKPPINDYDIRYRKFKSSNLDQWQLWPHGTADSDTAANPARSAKITRRLPATEADPLEPRTQYEVQVRAKNGENDAQENWSSIGRGTTGPSNSRPSFDRTDSVVELRVDENTRAGQNVGSAISASDADSNGLRYSLEGPGKDSFTIVSSSGQIRTKSPLDFETRRSYSVTVKVDDGQNRKNSVAAKSVTITVDNVIEIPSAPAAPKVAGIPGSTDSVRVTWDAPANTGPSVTHYEVHYREAGIGTGFGRWTHFGVDRSTIITGLKAGTRYEVQVRARTDEGTSDWSRSGTGMPNPDVANRAPTFSGGARSLNVPENTLSNTDIGAPIAATDRDGDVLTYTLEGTDADSFDIHSTSDGGQIRTSAALNFEEKASYAVTVRVTDGRGGTDAVNTTIRVTDVDNEAPDTPFAPRVTAVSSTRLQVTWEAPANAGPPITDYDYRYREPGGSWTEVKNTTITDTAVTIEGLAASTSYDVEVRATNAEGTSEWSNPGIGSTNAPGANNPPVFDEGRSAARSVSAAAQAGTNIGDPVAATDADSGDTLTYSLEGRDSAFFDIDDSTGQLLTMSGITLIAGETYTVTVVADDGTDTAEITVTIEATAAPPNAVPVFTEGPATTRSIPEGTPAGTNIGAPIAATDADTGDTVTYSLDGTDAASFAIVASSGQIQTRAALDASAKATYSVIVVASDGKDSARITVTITVTERLNSPPVFPGASTTRSVVEPAAPFAEIGSPVSATDADGDTLSYTLGGTDAASFFIDPSTGQLFTRIALAVATRASYSVIVVASDGEAEARITVTINVNPPPNNAPVFDEGSSATRTVRDDATSGVNVGSPVAATDADAGDTITYRLEGTDAVSFSIVASSGQIQTSAALDASTKSTYSVIVVASDGKDSARITVTITVTAAPVSYGCATLGAVTDTSNTGLVADCEALMASRNLLEGNTGRLNWSPSTPINQWEGVSLRGTPSRVTYLTLSSKGLDGIIPADLGELSMLVWLNLRSNSLSGSIPSELNSLTRLERLLLHNNRLSGPIPTLSGLSNLEMLWLSGRDMALTGNLPSWLNSMSSLESLSLWGNELSGPIPRLTGMTSLSLLKLQSNNLSGGVPAWFGDMNGPAILYLHDNELTGSIPANLGRNTGVIRLWLDRNNLSGSIPPALSGMTGLRTLNLRDNQLTGSIPPQLGTLSRLQQLRLHNNQLTGVIPPELGHLSELTQLAVSNNRLTGTIPSELGDLGKLGLLWLSDNQLTGTIPSELGDLGDTLANIRLAGNSFDATACVPSGLANVATNDYSEAGLSVCP